MTLNSHSEWRDWKVPEVRFVCVCVCVRVFVCLCTCTCDSLWRADDSLGITTLWIRGTSGSTGNLATPTPHSCRVRIRVSIGLGLLNPVSCIRRRGPLSLCTPRLHEDPSTDVSPGVDLAQLCGLHRVASCRGDQLHRLLEVLAGA